MREEVKALLRIRSCECCTQEQQHQRIFCSPFSHPASTLFMMFCYYWQGEVCILYPASLAGPCFLCFQNGSPHPLFENQCYQEISKKKKQLLPFDVWQLEACSDGENRIRAMFHSGQKKALEGICHQESSVSLGHLSTEASPWGIIQLLPGHSF